MPLYEYLCLKCQVKFTVLVKGFTESSPASCPRCGNTETERAVSTFAYHKSMQTIHEESGEPTLHSGTDFYKDPRNIGRFTEQKFRDIGMEVPKEIKEEISAARDGKLPDDLTK
jgi:putative FmdB family regulatory protein